MITTNIQIRFADIDMLRHVNNVTIQHYYDLGKSDYFKRVLQINPVWDKYGFVAAANQSNFKNQIRIDNSIAVQTKIIRIGTKSVTFFQQIVEIETKEVMSDCTSVLVAFEVASSGSIEIPNDWREKISNYEQL